MKTFKAALLPKAVEGSLFSSPFSSARAPFPGESASQFALDIVRQGDELVDTELLGAPRQVGAGEKSIVAARRAGTVELGEQRTQGVAQHLAPLLEHTLHHTGKQCLVALKLPPSVAVKPHDGAAHLGGRVEHSGLDGKEVVDVVPRLHKDAQHAISPAARRRGQPQGHFALYHARAAGDELTVGKELEEYLATDVVGIVTRQDEGTPGENFRQGKAEEIALDNGAVELRKVLAQVGHALAVHFDHFQHTPLRSQILREHAHARPHFEQGKARAGVDGVGDGTGGWLVGQEVLAERLLGADVSHHGFSFFAGDGHFGHKVSVFSAPDRRLTGRRTFFRGARGPSVALFHYICCRSHARHAGSSDFTFSMDEKQDEKNTAGARLLKSLLKLALPFVLGLGILWWMYRDAEWPRLWQTVRSMRWEWMAASMVPGVAAQVFRALRWRQSLAPLGERPRRRTCIDAVYLSYAASLVIPRVGEVTRCGTLKEREGTSFAGSLGTVVTERAVDSAVLLAFTGLAFLLQLPTLARFLEQTGTDVGAALGRFTGTGYIVTAICIVALGAGLYALMTRLEAFSRARGVFLSLWAGIVSLRGVRNLPLYIAYSVGIWVAYFLHFYLAFFCFDFTSGIGPGAALAIFCVGSFAVLVPTPNGAGPWHFAVKTMLVLYGVDGVAAADFALVVHTLQTMLVVVLGVYALVDLPLIRRRSTLSANR